LRMTDDIGLMQRIPDRRIDLRIGKGFLDAGSCAALIGAIDARRRPSTIADDGGEPAFRTSETCDLDRDDPVVAALDIRLAALLGIDPALGEPLQGQRYAVGQEFKPHTDYFEPTGIDYHRFCAVTGQRTWTAMVYLNVPEAGGATRFRTIDKIVQPETGKLVCWNNLGPDGRVNGATLHQGMKVRQGVKYVVTKWFRERPWGG